MNSNVESQVRERLSQYKGELDVDVEAILTQLKFNMFEGISQEEVEKALIMVVRAMLEKGPEYSRLAARLLLRKMYDEVTASTNSVHSNPSKVHQDAFIQNIEAAVAKGDLDERMGYFDLPRLAAAMDDSRDNLFEYMGLEIMSSRYCMSNPHTGQLLETPQMFWMRVAMGLALNEKAEMIDDVAIDFYNVMSEFYYTPGGRTLFQSGFKKAQLANCFINTVPDDLLAIYKSFSDNAQYLKWSGGTGTDWTQLRGTGAFIKGTGVGSQGIIPFIKIANDTNIAINRSGKRRGAGAVYLETWHYDIEEFLELRKNTGDDRRRAHDTNTANWIPDLFMKRVRDGGEWTLFSPDEVPELHDLYGKAFEAKYKEYEAKTKAGEIKLFKTIEAKELWKKMIGMLFETGHPWMTWKDPFNVRSPQDHDGVIHSSNLCTEIGLNTSADETAVCTLGSINFAKFIKDGEFDAELVGKVVTTSIRMLDNVIDLNFYPTEDARRGSTRHRPVGLGIRGYHDALYQLGLNFESPEAVKFSSESMELVSWHAINASSDLAKERGSYSTFPGSKWSKGIMPHDTIALLAKERGEEIEVEVNETLDWDHLRMKVADQGMRNSNTMAIAPTASTANLVGCVPCVEPIFKNIYVKSNKEGEFTVVNKYLIEDLRQLGLWNDDMLRAIKVSDGSIQNLANIPADIRAKYKEVFEIDQHWLIKAAAARGVWIDQSQSINVFFSGTSGKELSEIYFAAWRAGLKSTYYLRTMGASQVEKSTVSGVTHIRKTANVGMSTTAPIITTKPPEEDCESCSA